MGEGQGGCLGESDEQEEYLEELHKEGKDGQRESP